MKSERSIVREILVKLGIIPELLIWKNDVGLFLTLDGSRKARVGLPGSPDLIGIKRVLITADMVGTYIGQFVGVEVKTATGRQSKQQSNFQKVTERLGGKYVLARSVGDAMKGLELC